MNVETVVCGVVGVAFIGSGLWAFVDADSFYRVIAKYPPYNAHFLHDIGSFLVGFGVALTVAVYVHDGLRVALAGNAAAAVLHAADVAQTRNLLAAAGHVGHLVYVSIVGIDQIPLRYYRRKLECEGAIAGGTVPYTILRATQFHELLAGPLSVMQRLRVGLLPMDWRFQLVAAADVAAHLADVVEREPSHGIDNFAGPRSSSYARWRRRGVGCAAR